MYEKFKKGAVVKLIRSPGVAKPGATATVIRDWKAEDVYVHIVWDRSIPLCNRQQDGRYFPMQFELVEEAPLTDQELADAYRASRKETAKLVDEIKARGFTLQFSRNGGSWGNCQWRSPGVVPPEECEFRLRKVETTVKEVIF